MSDSPAKARAYALRLLSYRARSRKEMLQKLKRKGFSEGHIRSTMQYLERSGLMNDEALASELFTCATERKSLGKNGVRMFMLKRGIDRELVDSVLHDHSADAEEASAGKFVERKLQTLKRHPEETVKRKLGGMLQRRGYSTDVIYKTIQTIKL